MRVTYIHKGTKLTVERLGGLDETESEELLQMIQNGDERLRISVTDDLGETFVGSMGEFDNDAFFEQGPVNPREN